MPGNFKLRFWVERWLDLYLQACDPDIESILAANAEAGELEDAHGLPDLVLYLFRIDLEATRAAPPWANRKLQSSIRALPIILRELVDLPDD